MEAERKLAAFQEVLDDLLEATSSSRTTIRLDSPSDGFHLDAVAAEALAPGIRTLKDDTSITNLRDVPTVRFLDEERRLLVQNDCLTADPAVPRKLIEFYGVKAQMLGPIVREGDLIGVVSVHHNPGPREWSARDIEALQDAVHRVQQTLA